MTTSPTDPTVVGLFAGPGGWAQGLRHLGLTERGLDVSVPAVLTATAAGHLREGADVAQDPTLTPSARADALMTAADVAATDPQEWVAKRFSTQPTGHVDSPPCQGFSMAGKGRSRDDSVHLLHRLEGVTTRSDLERVVRDLGPRMTDARTLLVLEPLRWALALTPSWVAWEQVPGVLPLWQECAAVLRRVGYSVATGNIQAEQYGVPQTRRRAILVARSADFADQHGPAALPTPTHSRYYPRTPERRDPGVLPWISMGEALGGGYEGLAVRSNYGTGGDPAARGVRTADQPAAAVTGKVGRNKWVPEFNDQTGTEYDPDWPFKRPATAVAGRGLVQNPGATANRFNGSTKSRNDGVRVTVQEAALLQSFPADYPWHGTTSQQYQQVGDAVPPLLARAIVSAVANIPLEVRP